MARGDYPKSANDMAELSLEELNTHIQRCLWGYENGGASQGRKAFFKRLIQLEAERERIHGVPAPKRRF